MKRCSNLLIALFVAFIEVASSSSSSSPQTTTTTTPPPKNIGSCFMCQIGDPSCNRNQFQKSAQLLTECNTNACYFIKAIKEGGGEWNGRGCADRMLEKTSDYCDEYKEGGYVGKKCYCFSEQCNMGTSMFGVGVSRVLAGVLLTLFLTLILV